MQARIASRTEAATRTLRLSSIFRWYAADFGGEGRPVVLVHGAFADADLVICVGAIEPHLLLGFGGGLKMIVPGCAGQETIGILKLDVEGSEKEIFSDEFNKSHICKGCNKQIDFTKCTLDASGGTSAPR